MNFKSPRWLILVLVVGLALAATPASAQQQEHCGDIRHNETWGPGVTHLVCSAGVRVQNSTLTLAPGADILMGDGADLVIASGSKLVALGTEAATIRIRAVARDDAPGSWGQIRFEPGAEESIMARITVQSGGKDNVPMVQSAETVVLMDWITLRKALDVPLAFGAAPLGPSLEAPGQATIGACDRVKFTSNGTTLIEVLGDAEYDVTETETWHNFCAPYRLKEEVRIGSELDPMLIIDLGVVIYFEGDGTFTAGMDEAHPGMLVVNGSPEEPVTLTGAKAEPGAWGGIVLGPYSSLSGFNITNFLYGGADGVPMLTVMTPDATALSLTFKGSASYPLAIIPSGVASFMSSLVDTEEEVFVDNVIQRVIVLAKEEPVLGRTATWGTAGAAYELDGTLTVAGNTLPRLTLDPGTTLVFREGTALVIGDGNLGPGEFVARGAKDGPVTLTSVKGTPGSWLGLKITDDALLATLDYAVIEYGGADGSPMVDWGRTTGDISRTTFRGAKAYPVALPLSQAADVILNPEVPDAEPDTDLSNTLEGNGTDRVLIRSNRTLSQSATEWRDPGAPVEFDGTVFVSSPTRPLLDMKPGLDLVFRQGASFNLGDGNGRAAVLIEAGDEGDEPVTFRPANPEAGWFGIRVNSSSSLRARGLVVKDVAQTGAAILVDDGSALLDGIELSGRDRGTGIEAEGFGASVRIESADIGHFGAGIVTREAAVAEVTRSVIHDNVDWGFKNEDPDLCLIANLVYWGSAHGPNDESDAKDDCLNGANASPGDRVSDDVDWWPYAINLQFDPSPGLGPNPKKAYCPFSSKGK